MSSRASITVLRPQDEIERLWHDPAYRPEHVSGSDATVRFTVAPGDRGTEIHVELRRRPPAGKLGESIQKLLGTEPLAKVKDDLRRFKQRVETGEVARSEAAPEGEALERKLKRRAAQPLDQRELQKVGA